MLTRNVPAGVFAAVLMVRVTLTGLLVVGSTEFEGAKLQVAPAGNLRRSFCRTAVPSSP
jgi:hypothetical protein